MNYPTIVFNGNEYGVEITSWNKNDPTDFEYNLLDEKGEIHPINDELSDDDLSKVTDLIYDIDWDGFYFTEPY